MFGILLVSVGVAWWLVQGQKALLDRGREIIAQIRTEKLESFWDRRPSRLWYIKTDSTGRAVSWRAAYRDYVPARDVYRGSAFSGSHDLLARAEWELSPDAGAGEYSSTVAGRNGQAFTVIRLRDGEVKVLRVVPRGSARAATAAPDNYIAEGTLELAVRLVARAGREASFRMIIDDAAIAQGQVRFIVVKMIPRGPRRVQVEMGGFREVYHFDESWRIVKIELPETRELFNLVSESQVLSKFPDTAIPRPPDAPASQEVNPEKKVTL